MPYTVELLDFPREEKPGRRHQEWPRAAIASCVKKGGWVDIAAYVPPSLAAKMVKTICRNAEARHLYVCQASRGMMLIDARVTAPVAASIRIAGRRAGVPIRRH
jgi:hypothetical protein